MTGQNANDALLRHRHTSAEASGGTSADVIYDCIVRAIGKQNPGGSVLDYGAGVGNLTKKLRDLSRFEKIVGADLMPRPVSLQPDVDWLCLDLNAPIPADTGTFDVVIGSEVIEHLENPREMTRDIFRVLRPGGCLILTTPNNESWRSLIALLVRGHFVSFSDSCYPAHITALLRKDLERILREAGFSDIRFDFTDAGDIPGTAGLTWQAASLGLLKGLRFSDNLLVAAVKPPEVSPARLFG